MKCAVIYYSKSGNTKKIADKIQGRLNADSYLVEPEDAYGSYLSSVIQKNHLHLLDIVIFQLFQKEKINQFLYEAL